MKNIFSIGKNGMKNAVILLFHLPTTNFEDRLSPTKNFVSIRFNESPLKNDRKYLLFHVKKVLFVVVICTVLLW